MNQADIPKDSIEVKPGIRVQWRHSEGIILFGTVGERFGSGRLWNVTADIGSKHVVGSWILQAMGGQ